MKGRGMGWDGNYKQKRFRHKGKKKRDFRLFSWYHNFLSALFLGKRVGRCDVTEKPDRRGTRHLVIRVFHCFFTDSLVLFYPRSSSSMSHSSATKFATLTHTTFRPYLRPSTATSTLPSVFFQKESLEGRRERIE